MFPIWLTLGMATSLSPSKSIAAKVRAEAGLGAKEGPTDATIGAAIAGFAGQIDYWFTRVIAGSVRQYRKIIVRRINPLIRPIEFEGLPASKVADRLVSDYVNRNFVTAGGWAIEKMAIAIGATGNKAVAKGIDLHRIDGKGDHHLYVIKSGTVTRNSDILSKLKQHARDAEKLLKQGGAKIGVFANYAVATGATSSTFEDGIYRPSSGQFWSEVTGLPESKAVALISAVAKAGGLQVTRNTDVHIKALMSLVSMYIAEPGNALVVDWPFIFKLTMTDKTTWADEDKARDKKAVSALTATGYQIPEKEHP